jgi:hypothetical protein
MESTFAGEANRLASAGMASRGVTGFALCAATASNAGITGPQASWLGPVTSCRTENSLGATGTNRMFIFVGGSSRLGCAGVIFLWFAILRSVFATGTFIPVWVGHVPDLAGAFLDAPDQFLLFAFGELQMVIRELREFLFQFAFGDVPVGD